MALWSVSLYIRDRKATVQKCYGCSIAFFEKYRNAPNNLVIKHIDRRVIGKNSAGNLIYGSDFTNTYYHPNISHIKRKNPVFTGLVYISTLRTTLWMPVAVKCWIVSVKYITKKAFAIHFQNWPSSVSYEVTVKKCRSVSTFKASPVFEYLYFLLLFQRWFELKTTFFSSQVCILEQQKNFFSCQSFVRRC